VIRSRVSPAWTAGPQAPLPSDEVTSASPSKFVTTAGGVGDGTPDGSVGDWFDTVPAGMRPPHAETHTNAHAVMISLVTSTPPPF
jgi:hypothetical protein